MLSCYVLCVQWLLEERIVERLVDFIKDNEEEDSDGEVRGEGGEGRGVMGRL